MSRPPTFSEKTAREIDQEVRRIVEESLEKVRTLLERRRPALEALAQRLMEREVIDGAEMRAVIDETSPGPWIVPGTAADRARRPAASDSAEPRNGPAEETG
jgi:cell division protease FtsH